MSILDEYRTLEHALKAYQDRLEWLKNSEELCRDLVFEQKLLTLLNHHSMRIEDLLSFIPRTVQQPMLCVREKSAAYKVCGPAKRKAGRPRKA